MDLIDFPSYIDFAGIQEVTFEDKDGQAFGVSFEAVRFYSEADLRDFDIHYLDEDGESVEGPVSEDEYYEIRSDLEVFLDEMNFPEERDY